MPPEELKAKVLALVHANLDVPGLATGVLKEILKPALDKVVKDTSTVFDDILLASVYPTLEKALIEEMNKLWESIFAKQDGAEVLGAPV